MEKHPVEDGPLRMSGTIESKPRTHVRGILPRMLRMSDSVGTHSIHGLTSGDLRRYFKKGELEMEQAEYKIVLLHARDWSIDEGPTDVNHVWKPYSAWVCGFLLRETDDSYILCPELFDDRARHIQTIPKECVKEVKILSLQIDPSPIPS